MAAMVKSDIEWLDEVPTEWGTTRLGNSVYMKGRIGWQGLRFDDFIDEGPYLVTGTDFEKGKIVWPRCYHISKSKYSEDPAIHLCSKDVLFTKDGTVGKVAYVDNLPGPATLNSHLLLLRPKTEELNSGYLFWVLQSSVFERYKNLVQHGSIMDSISQTDMSRFIIPLPPQEEQEAIVTHLDAKIGLNDRLIAMVEKQISVLERYRTSVVHKVVNRGLASSTRLKSSGVDWLGDIPISWRMNRLRYLCSIESGATPSKDVITFWDGKNPWVSSMEVKSHILKDTTLHISDEAINSCSTRLLPAGTLVMVVRSGILQHTIPVAILGKPMTINQDIKALLFDSSVMPNYFYYFIQGNNENLLKVLLKDKSTVDNINQEYLKSLLIPVPSLEEQKEIVDYLDSHTAAIDATLGTKRKQLDILKRRRQSLINEYVTGKRRVTEEA